ncbi:hypothetical protein G6F24_017204 [Rhizopus arrhizus]|nr:hypothetical protein G6F24_017204 [Rhizopus arrhizus]
MASTGEEVIGSMGNDAPLAVLSDRAKPFYNYFPGDVAGVVHRPQAQPAGHQQRQPAAAPGSVPAGAGLRRHGADPRHRAGHGQEVPQL